MGNKPEKTFRIGTVKADVWKNEGESNGKKFTTFSVSMQKSYKDKEGNWKQSQNFNELDVPKLKLCLDEAFKYISFEARASDSPDKVEEEIIE